MDILERILTDPLNRKKLIKEFQELVWNDEDSIRILKDLAYDLDFYEPNEALRKQDHSYYDDERLEKEIRITIQKLKKLDQENL